MFINLLKHLKNINVCEKLQCKQFQKVIHLYNSIVNFIV